MSEPEEENPENQTFLSKSRDLITLHSVDKELLMDVDFALDSSWPLDQISFASSPMSPFLFSSSEQPPSPLWVFSDVEDDKLAGNASSTPIAGGLRLSDCPRSPLLALNIDTPDPVNESAVENDDERRLAPVRTPLELDRSCMIKEKMSQALRYFKESTEQHVLAQVWVPSQEWGSVCTHNFRATLYS
ncbi:hypothetical protein L1049_021544 [Liquidambar formosana]|uniref:Uncharacterized protein n=1 Tax=Liquidambar formosana TaxID=63359 RepID=A0AAP0QZ34_LIQFO